MEHDIHLLEQLVTRLERIEQAIGALSKVRSAKDRYTVEEVAEILGKAPFTVREWARNGRIKAEKRACGRGRTQEWAISHEELHRIQNDGLLPVEGFVYRYGGD